MDTTESERKNLRKIRNYFGENDKTGFEHWAYDFLNTFLNKRVQAQANESEKDSASGVRVNALVRLRQETNKVCAELQEEKADISGAINWGDLGCVNAEKCLDHHGNEYYRVLIEEANPDCSELQARVGEELSKRGFRTFVWTQW